MQSRSAQRKSPRTSGDPKLGGDASHPERYILVGCTKHMEPKPLVRVARLCDIDEVVKLCSEHARFEKSSFSPEGKAYRLSGALFAGVPRLWCFVAECGGSVVGYATCTKDYSTWRAADFLHMDCLYLEPAYRNSGVGTEMMHRIARHAAALDCATVEWQTPAWNANAARFYQNLGATSSEKVRFRWDTRTVIP